MTCIGFCHKDDYLLSSWYTYGASKHYKGLLRGIRTSFIICTQTTYTKMVRKTYFNFFSSNTRENIIKKTKQNAQPL